MKRMQGGGLQKKHLAAVFKSLNTIFWVPSPWYLNEASAPLFCRKKDLLGHVSLGKVTAT